MTALIVALMIAPTAILAVQLHGWRKRAERAEAELTEESVAWLRSMGGAS